MAFPGEHYHNLLSHLASEIYHNRYPVEHGVDILQGVIRTAGPDAVRVRYWYSSGVLFCWRADISNCFGLSYR